MWKQKSQRKEKKSTTSDSDEEVRNIEVQSVHTITEIEGQKVYPQTQSNISEQTFHRWKNASKGTDHGAAAPMFVVGEKMKRGILGEPPSLKPEDLLKGDIRHSIDFRSVYATLLEQHLRAPSQPIVGGKYPLLNLL